MVCWTMIVELTCWQVCERKIEQLAKIGEGKRPEGLSPLVAVCKGEEGVSPWNAPNLRGALVASVGEK